MVGVDGGEQARELAIGHPHVAVDHAAVEPVLAARDADRVGERAPLGRERRQGERYDSEDPGVADGSHRPYLTCGDSATVAPLAAGT